MNTKNQFYFLVSAPGVLAGLTLLIVGVSAAYYVAQLNRDVSRLVAVNVQNERASEELLLSVRDIRLRLHEFLAIRDWEMLQAVMAKRKKTSEMILNVVSHSPAIDDDPKSAVEAHARFFKKLDELVSSQPEKEVAQRVLPILDDLTKGLLNEVEEFHTTNQQSLKKATRQNLSAARGLVWGLLALGVCGGAAGVVSGFRIAASTVHRVEQSEREAARSGQLATVGKIAAGLAHELHNPLMTMQVLTQGATEHGEEGRLEGRDLVVLEEEIKRLNRLVQSFLDFARPPESEPVDIDFREVIDRTVNLLTGRADRQKVWFESNLPDGPLTIRADPAQMRQVLLNLLLNAIEAQPQGGKITIRAGFVALKNERQLEVCIQDTGVGIAEGKLIEIFEPFVSFKETGMGLGLSVCKRIVESHGGRISAEEVPNSGSRFVITIPLTVGE